MSLTQYHHLNPTFVFPPACGRVLTRFPAIWIDPYGSVENGSVAERRARVGAGSGDGTAAVHSNVTTTSGSQTLEVSFLSVVAHSVQSGARSLSKVI